ncbi:MAG: uroporphyrinogen decarboxylase family protein, partial [Anaerolineae bacterium]
WVKLRFTHHNQLTGGCPMNKAQRVLAALSREEPDCVPLYDLVDNSAVIAHYAGTALTLENAGEVIPLALSRMLDTTRVWLPAAPGRRVDGRGFTHERGDWWNEWQVGKPFHDMESLRAFVGRDIERAQSHHLDGARDHLDDRLGDRLRWKEHFLGTVIPASTAAEALTAAYIDVGLDWFVLLGAEDPALTRRWVDALHALTMQHLQAEGDVRQVSPVAWVFADMAFKERLMFSPAYLRENGVFRRIAEFCALYHDRGLKVIFHSDGYIRPIVPDLIEAGVDALAPIETSAGLDLGDLKAAFGRRVAFVGGIDMPEVLRYGSVDDVRRAVLRALHVAGPGGGFVLGSSSEELYEALPPQNVIAMVETARECGRYPIGQYFPKHFDWR